MHYVSREQLLEQMTKIRGQLNIYVSEALKSQHQRMVKLGQRKNFKILMDQIEDLDQQFKSIELALAQEINEQENTNAPVAATTRA